MAITITTAISANVAAFASVPLAGTTTRNPFDSEGTRQNNAIISLSDSGGFLRIEIVSNANYIAGDSILISGATTDFAQFNGRHNVTSLSGTTYIITDKVWASATTGSKGTIYRMNDGLAVRADVLNASSDVIAQLYSSVDVLTGAFYFDVSKALQSELFSDFTLTTGEADCNGAAHSYTVKLYETYLNAAYVSMSVYQAAGDQTTIAHRTTLYSDDYVSGLLQLTGNFYAATKVCMHFITDKTDDVRLKIRPFTAGVEGTTVNYTLTENVHGHRQYTFTMPTCDYILLSVEWYNTETTAYVTIKSAVIVKTIKSCSTLLYFTNRLGGYEAYEFNDYTDTQETEKIDKYTAEAWQERSLVGNTYAKATNQNIRDVVTSPAVYDIDGTLVRVLTESIDYKDTTVQPQIKIRYDETFIS